MPDVWFYQISPEAMVISQEAKVTEVVNPATGLELFGVSLGQECHERKWAITSFLPVLAIKKGSD